MEHTVFLIAHLLFWVSMVLGNTIGTEKTMKYFYCAECFFVGGMAMHIILDLV